MARRRERALRDRVIAGTLVTTEKQLAVLTAAEADSRALAIGAVPIPARLETRHMAMIGTTGSGKTTALRQLLDGIEARGEAALVYDTCGEFVAHYYRPDRGDIILNPFDARCAFWSPFAEIGHPADAARIAHQFITETGHYAAKEEQSGQPTNEAQQDALAGQRQSARYRATIIAITHHGAGGNAILRSFVCDIDCRIRIRIGSDPKRSARIGVNTDRPLLVLVEHRIGRADRTQGDRRRHDCDLSLEPLPLAETMMPAQGVGMDAAVMGLGHGRFSCESRR